ncbi:MAG: 2TM domain-containing protein [Solirubrobacterales bacterium]
MDANSEAVTGEKRRELALERLKKKRDFKAHLVMYISVNVLLIVIWAVSGTDTFFWPIFVLVGWGIGLVANAWDVYGRKPISEDEVQQEMDRLG